MKLKKLLQLTGKETVQIVCGDRCLYWDYLEELFVVIETDSIGKGKFTILATRNLSLAIESLTKSNSY